MLKRIFFVSRPSRLTCKYNQLVATATDDTAEESRAPVEDLGFVVLESPQISLTHQLVQKLLEHNVALVFCDTSFLPAGMLLPLQSHHIQGERFRKQIQASAPLKKQLWKQTVQEKIRNQGGLLCHLGRSEPPSWQYLAKQVASGDTTHVESTAAQRYWPLLFDKGFVRDRAGAWPNAMLNYGYSILRAAVARALAGSGLLATLGIHHHNRYNAFCLADDVMEPFRPVVDEKVWQRWQATSAEEATALTTEDKKTMLELLLQDVVMDKKKSPLMVALSKTSSSLAACFEGRRAKISYPKLIFSAAQTHAME